MLKFEEELFFDDDEFEEIMEHRSGTMNLDAMNDFQVIEDFDYFENDLHYDSLPF